MDYIRFGNLIPMIRLLAKEKADELNKPVEIGYKKNTDTMAIFGDILFGDIPELYTNYDVSFSESSQTSKVVSGKANIQKDIIDYYQKADREIILNNLEEKIIDIFQADTFFSDTKLCQLLLQEFEAPSYQVAKYRHNPHAPKDQDPFYLDVDQLRELYEDGCYVEFLALVCYYLVTYIDNNNELSDQMKRYKMEVQEISDSMFDDIQLNRYYEDFYRKIIIVPRYDINKVEITTTTKYISPFLNPKQSSNKEWFVENSFATDGLRKQHDIISFNVNGVDYSSKIVREEFEDFEKRFSYKKKYSVLGVPMQDNYEVTMVAKTTHSMKFFSLAYRLQLPCKKFQLSIEIRGEDRQKYNLGFQMFSTRRHASFPNSVSRELYGGTAAAQINQWMPARTGYEYTVRPKQERLADFFSREELQAALNALDKRESKM